jgi:hypothetical protein
MADLTPPSRHRELFRWSQLKTERSSWIPHWSELSKNLQPRLGRFFVTDRNRGEKRHNSIYDSTGTRALRVLAAGMMAGMTSPARPWFRLTTADTDVSESHDARVWLSDVRRIMLDVYQRSNTYRAFQGIYEELGCFGTAASIVLPNFAKVQHHYPSTIGEYCIATDFEGKVDTFYREFQMQVTQIVAQFGRENCSPTVRNLYDRGSYDTWLTVYHAIEPRGERDVQARDAKNMPWASHYFEAGANPGKYLSESGFRDFRALAPRWHATGGDIYGYSPGMEALGDVKQLQHEQLRKAQAIDYQTKPPLALPVSAKGHDVDIVPGGVSYFDSNTPHTGARTMFEARLDLSALLQDIGDVRGRVNAAFYADLFLMLASSDLGNMTATEVAERHEEKLLMLGPVLERLHNELLDPLIRLTFNDLLEAGAIPPPPPALNGQPIRVEFVSMLAQAQRAVGTASTDRFVSNLGVVAGFKPDVLDKFDADKWVDAYADNLGVDPELIVADEKVALVRQQRAQAQQQAEATAQAEQLAGAANKAAGAPTQGGSSNALNDVMNMFSGYTSPGPEQY